MTVFRKKTPNEAPALWIATTDLPATPASGCYAKLDQVLAARQFGDAVRRLCTPYYNRDQQKGGRPGIDPEVYVKMLMVGFFENLARARAIARCTPRRFAR